MCTWSIGGTTRCTKVCWATSWTWDWSPTRPATRGWRLSPCAPTRWCSSAIRSIPLAERKSVKVKALAGQKFINFERDIPTRRALDKIFKEHRVTVEQVMAFDNIETVKRAVEIDSGVAIVPQETITQEVANQTLAAVELENGAYSRPLAVIYKKSKVLSPAIKQFIALLKEPA